MPPADPVAVALAAAAAVAAVVYFYYYSPRATQPDIHPLQLAQQAAVGSVRESPSESPVLRSKSTPDGARLLAAPPGDLRDLRCALRAGRRARRPNAVQTVVDGRVHATSSEEIHARVRAFSGGLLRLLGAAPAPAPRAAVLVLPASVEAVVAYQACVEAGVAAIPLAAAESPAAVARIVARSGAPLLITTAALAATLAPSMAAPSLTHIIAAGDLATTDAMAACSAAIVSFAALEQEAAPDADPVIVPADPAYVIYTTLDDDPKEPAGVVITHANALAALAGLAAALPATQALSARDTFLSVAPMAAAANLSFVNLALTLGCSLGLAETDDAEVFAAHAFLIRPTFTYLSSPVARDLVQLFKSSVQQYPRLERAMFDVGYHRAADSLMRGVLPKANLWDLMYFRHYRNALGGGLRLVYIDARATPSADIEWLRVLHGAAVIPTFGTPWTTGVATAGQFYDYATAIAAHHVGAPLACNEIKLVDAPEAGLFAEDQPNPRGAISVRGPNVATRLWNDPGHTRLEDDWLLLPCYGEILPIGTIDIIGDRKAAR
ncbi:medium-chain fatty acid-CoA ligase faa2 [Coemansia javaensis]|uniref:Medium-chain fatty acid-CoA ligase faa2 n=1 Tax=Coemansia javaensis TaxID=2761396 RepID=A0A9W8H3A3_9FUNG|nr:medium-chain fatty acid-CoA ligase faa2 [Coemansia javaensis]